MLFNVIGYSNEIIGQVEASDIVEAWSEAGKRFSNILDIRQVEEPYGEEEEKQYLEEEYYRGKGFRIVHSRADKQKRKYPVAWDIRIEHPDVDSPKWENYKRLIEYFKQRKLRGRDAPGTGTVIIENVPTQSMVEELTLLIKSYDLEVIDVVAVEQVPELGDKEEE